MARSLAKEITEGDLSPIYLFYGAESYLIERMYHFIRERVVPIDDQEMNVVEMDLEEIPVEALIQEAETPPFFGERRLIIGKGAWFLTAAKGKSKVEHNLEELLRYVMSPLSSSVVILIVPGEKLDKRKKVVKELEKRWRSLCFEPLAGKELTTWVANCIKEKGVRTKPEAVSRLIALVGSDLRTLHNECAKLATYVGRDGIVTLEMVDQLVPRTLEQDVFKLTDHVARRKTDQALAVFYDLLQNREEPIRILALIIRQFRILLQVRVLAGQGKSEREIASILGLHPYPVKLAYRQGKSFSEKSLRLFLRRAIEADQGIKSRKNR